MSFFVAGGTVPPGSPSYVERAADRELLEALLGGEFCYVLNSRQMGKSSLAVRTIASLKEAGVRTAFVDLTRLGATGADPERWYAGLMVETGRALGLRSEAMNYLKANAALPAVARLFGFLRDVALAPPLQVDRLGEGVGGRGERIVLLIDEIDAVRSLPFPADDLFAGLRELWNARASDPTLNRLTVCLLGAALPSDLIVDPRRTPFNVGRRIDLRDFTAEEAWPFAEVVGEEALARVLHWTGGHPFLTQALCAELAGGGSADASSASGPRTPRPPKDVDALVQSRYLDARARETDTNLADVGRRLLGEGDPDLGDEERATTLAIYERMLKGKDVPDDESNPAAARIKMSGVAQVEDGRLRVRNRIYAEAFDSRWVRDNTPGQELRRQRRAFWKGALRTGSVSAAVIAVVGWLAWNNARLARIADAQRQTALKDYYAATMQGLEGKQAANDITAIARTLDALKDNPSRGWEWDHWNVVAHPALRTITVGNGDHRPVLLADGRTAIRPNGDGIEVFDLRGGRPGGTIALPRSERGHWVPVPLRSGEALLFDGTSTMARVDVEKRKVVQTLKLPFRAAVNAYQTGPVGRTFPITDWHPDGTSNTELLDTRTLGTRPYPDDRRDLAVTDVSFCPDGSRAALFEYVTDRKGRWAMRASIRASDDWHEIQAIDLGAKYCGGFGWSPDGRWLTFARENGEVYLADLRTATVSPRLVAKLPKTAYNALPSADGRTVIVCGNREARELDSKSGQVIRSYPETSFIWPLDGGREILTYYWDFRIYRAGEVERGERTRTLPRNVYPSGFGTRVDPDGRVMAFPTDDSGMWTLDVRRSGPATHSDQHYSPDRRGLIAVLNGVRGSALVDNATGRRLPFRIDPSLSATMAVTRDRRTVVVGHDGGSFAVHDAASARPKAILPVDGEPRGAEFSGDDRWLALGSSRGGVTIFDATTWKQVGRVQLGSGPIDLFSFAKDGRSLYAVDDQQVAVLDVPTGRIRTKLVGNSDAVFCTAVHPDGTRLATGAADGTVRVWDANDGRELTILGHHPSGVVAVGFIDGGRSLVSVDDEGGIRVWLSQREGP